MPWMMEAANERGIPADTIRFEGMPSVEGDTYEVRLFSGTEEISRKNFYVDANGMHEVSKDKK